MLQLRQNLTQYLLKHPKRYEIELFILCIPHTNCNGELKVLLLYKHLHHCSQLRQSSLPKDVTKGSIPKIDNPCNLQLYSVLCPKSISKKKEVSEITKTCKMLMTEQMLFFTLVILCCRQQKRLVPLCNHNHQQRLDHRLNF